MKTNLHNAAMRKGMLNILAVVFFGFSALPGAGQTTVPEHSAAAAPEKFRSGSTIRVASLKCEGLEKPLSVETMLPHLSWILVATDPSRRGLRQSAYRILVSTTQEKLAAGEGDAWDTKKVNSAQTMQIEYRGAPLRSDQTYFWKVQVWDQDDKASDWIEAGEWMTGLTAAEDWKAKWISAKADIKKNLPANEKDTIKNEALEGDGKPLPIFRHEFTLDSSVKRAVVRISGLGQYELRINGRIVNENSLMPGWSDYRKRIYYNTFDVGSLLHAGDNAIGILLGNGMYNVEKTPQRYQKFSGSMGQPKLIFQLSLIMADGRHANVLSDSSWKQTAGPITFSSTYGGEDFDARREQTGWDRPGFKDDNWQAAREVSGPGGKLIGELLPAVKVIHEFPNMKLTEPKAGVRVYDLGQNFSGWPKIMVRGAAGTVVKLIPGELLDEKGFVSQRSSGEPVWFSYVLRGDGEEIWHPRFSYYGFRYVQVEESAPGANVAQKPALTSIAGEFVHLSAARTGEFASSDTQLNRIHDLILAAIDSNLHSVITDCPHREKLGWLEQTHLLGNSLMYNYDLSQLYEKLADDMQDAQLANGLVPDIAPEFVQFEKGFRDSPEWGSAAILAVWTAYQQYGDQRILTDHYEMMKRYAEYLGSTAKGGIVSHGLGDWYDIGPGEPGESKLTGRGLTATAIYFQDLVTLEKVAAVLNKHEDAQNDARQANEVRAAFHAKLFHADKNEYDSGSQTANAMPLAVGLVDDSAKAAVLEHLVADIRKRENHVTAGDVGFHYVVTALLEGGRSSVLYDMISRNDNPSYGYQLQRGATTLTEAWDTNPSSSQNHFMLGHIEEWFHRGLAGVSINMAMARQRAEQIVIRPRIAGDVAWARDSQDSVLGKIASEWKRKGGTLALEVTIPVNARATIYVPVRTAGHVKENGRAIPQSTEIKKLGVAEEAEIFEVGSGVYHFESDF